MNLKKRKKVATVFMMLMCWACFVFFLTTIGANGSAKVGTYCEMTTVYGTDGIGTYEYVTAGVNLTTTTKMMSVSLKAYRKDNTLYSYDTESENTIPNAKRMATLTDIPSDFNVYAQTIIYGGTSISTTQLEYLTDKVDPN